MPGNREGDLKAAQGERIGVAAVASKMEAMQDEAMQDDARYFQIPPWMAYILRTFSVLEGIGLAQDEDYSIAQECYPYLARRLMTDNSPRAQEALRQMLYGGSGGAGQINVERLEELATGFQTYTASSQAVDRKEGLDKAAAQAAELVLSPEGNFIQQVLLEEVAALLDASGRTALGQFVNNPVGQLGVEALRQQRALAQQLPAPLRLAFLPADLAIDTLELLKAEQEDADALAVATRLWKLVQAGGSKADMEVLAAEIGLTDQAAGSAPAALRAPAGNPLQQIGLQLPRDVAEAQALVARLQELQPGLAATAARFASILLQRSASRLEQRLETHGHAMASTTVDFSQRVVAALDSLDDALEEYQQDLVRQAAERTALDPAAGVAHDVLTNVAGNEPAAAHMPTGPLTWSKDAQAELDRAPFFVKGPAKDGAEKYARQVGASEVTLVSEALQLYILSG